MTSASSSHCFVHIEIAVPIATSSQRTGDAYHRWQRQQEQRDAMMGLCRAADGCEEPVMTMRTEHQLKELSHTSLDFVGGRLSSSREEEKNANPVEGVNGKSKENDSRAERREPANCSHTTAKNDGSLAKDLSLAVQQGDAISLLPMASTSASSGWHTKLHRREPADAGREGLDGSVSSGRQSPLLHGQSPSYSAEWRQSTTQGAGAHAHAHDIFDEHCNGESALLTSRKLIYSSSGLTLPLAATAAAVDDDASAKTAETMVTAQPSLRPSLERDFHRKSSSEGSSSPLPAEAHAHSTSPCGIMVDMVKDGQQQLSRREKGADDAADHLSYFSSSAFFQSPFEVAHAVFSHSTPEIAAQGRENSGGGDAVGIHHSDAETSPTSDAKARGGPRRGKRVGSRSNASSSSFSNLHLASPVVPVYTEENLVSSARDGGTPHRYLSCNGDDIEDGIHSTSASPLPHEAEPVTATPFFVFSRQLAPLETDRHPSFALARPDHSGGSPMRSPELRGPLVDTPIRRDGMQEFAESTEEQRLCLFEKGARSPLTRGAPVQSSASPPPAATGDWDVGASPTGALAPPFHQWPLTQLLQQHRDAAASQPARTSSSEMKAEEDRGQQCWPLHRAPCSPSRQLEVHFAADLSQAASSPTHRRPPQRMLYPPPPSPSPPRSSRAIDASDAVTMLGEVADAEHQQEEGGTCSVEAEQENGKRSTFARESASEDFRKGRAGEAVAVRVMVAPADAPLEAAPVVGVTTEAVGFTADRAQRPTSEWTSATLGEDIAAVATDDVAIKIQDTCAGDARSASKQEEQKDRVEEAMKGTLAHRRRQMKTSSSTDADAVDDALALSPKTHEHAMREPSSPLSSSQMRRLPLGTSEGPVEGLSRQSDNTTGWTSSAIIGMPSPKPLENRLLCQGDAATVAPERQPQIRHDEELQLVPLPSHSAAPFINKRICLRSPPSLACAGATDTPDASSRCIQTNERASTADIEVAGVHRRETNLESTSDVAEGTSEYAYPRGTDSTQPLSASQERLSINRMENYDGQSPSSAAKLRSSAASPSPVRPPGDGSDTESTLFSSEPVLHGRSGPKSMSEWCAGSANSGINGKRKLCRGSTNERCDVDRGVADSARVDEALRKVEATNAALQQELSAATLRATAAENQVRAKEEECATLHALVERLQMELRATRGASRGVLTPPVQGAAWAGLSSTYTTVETPHTQEGDTLRDADGAVTALSSSLRAFIVPDNSDGPPRTQSAGENDGQSHYDALARELANVKESMAEQLAVLDQLGLQPPFTEERLRAAQERLLRVQVIPIPSTAANAPQLSPRAPLHCSMTRRDESEKLMDSSSLVQPFHEYQDGATRSIKKTDTKMIAELLRRRLRQKS